MIHRSQKTHCKWNRIFIIRIFLLFCYLNFLHILFLLFLYHLFPFKLCSYSPPSRVCFEYLLILFIFDYIYIDSVFRLNLTKFLLINNNLICFLKILIITLFLFIFILLFSLLHLLLFDIISYHLFNFASCSFLII